MRTRSILRNTRGESGTGVIRLLCVLLIFPILSHSWTLERIYVPSRSHCRRLQFNGFLPHSPAKSISSSRHFPLLFQLQKRTLSAGSSYPEDAALCIIPPDQAWDSLQRARHVALDESLSIWPPAIRLFHPIPSFTASSSLSSSSSSYSLDALDVARVVEQHQIEPFVVRLNQWAIIPHAEAITMATTLPTTGAAFESPQHDGDDINDEDNNNGIAMSLLPLKKHHTRTINNGIINSDNRNGPPPPLPHPWNEERARQAHIDALIEHEEKVGRRNKAFRKQRARDRLRDQQALYSQRQHENNPVKEEIEEEEDDDSNSRLKLSPREVVQQQQKMYEEFNGPCVVCLEPDEESKRRLVALRELFRVELFGDDFLDLYSPTATAIMRSSKNNVHRRATTGSSTTTTNGAYRPLVPIGAFETVNDAIRMARKLRLIWQPLSFEVTDLHLVSLFGGVVGREATANSSGEAMDRCGATGFRDSGIDDEAVMLKSISINTDRYRRQYSQQPLQIGCDAMIMLMGHELQAELNEQEAEQMASLLCEQGVVGGGDRSYRTAGHPEPMHRHRSKIRIDDDESDDLTVNHDSDMDESRDSVLQLLEDDDDDAEDEGTVVVIGRTHFFTGETRLYVGMPAMSTTEQAGSSKGDKTGDSGRARRRGAYRHSRLHDGTFGHVSRHDYEYDDDVEDYAY